MHSPHRSICAAAVAGLMALACAARGAPADEAAPPASPPLAANQRDLAESYKRLEEVLLRMAELSAATDPRRAALLKKAIAQSKEQLIGVQFESLVELLDKEQFSRAIDGQKQLKHDLQALLELLLSENRSKRIESERARITQYLKDLNALIRDQKSVQGRTVGGQPPPSLADEQKQLADKTGGLAEQMKAQAEASKPAPQAEGTPAARPAARPQAQPGASPPEGQDGKPESGKPESGKPSGDPKAKPADPTRDSPAGKPQTPPPSGESPTQPPAGKPQPGPSEEGGQQPPPGAEEEPQAGGAEQSAQQRLERARRRMQEAEKRLREAKQKDAVAEQDEAIRQLEQAKAELEEILRQLREEEMERVLAMLEARFRKMLNLQRDVLEGTQRLDKVPAGRRSHDHEIESGRLASREGEIVVEADKALLLLRDEGTAVAFPEAVGQMRQDMQQAATRLSEAKVDRVTQGIEEDVIAALEEMIAALKKAQKKLEEQKQAKGGGGGGGDPPLVDTLSELKMIRALQLRVNQRTGRYAAMLDGEQARPGDLLDALRQLAQRQDRIQQITRELEKGKGR